MTAFFNKLSLIPRGLRYKLIISFSLMSIIPILICLNLVSNYILPFRGDIRNVSILIIIATVISLLGFYLAKQIVDPIIKMAIEAKLIADGNIEHKIEVDSEDEVGKLGYSLNQLTRKIKENMEQLKHYGEETKRVNIEIHEKVLALSSILQIGDLMSKNAELDELFQFILEKVSQIEESSSIFLMLIETGTDELVMRSTWNVVNDEIKNLRMKSGTGFVSRILMGGENLIIDSKTGTLDKSRENLRELFGVKNLAILSLGSNKKIIGIFGIGNNEDGFTYRKEDIELITVFVKQASIAVENNLLFRKTEELAIKDDLTDLFNENYIRTRLDEEIKRAVRCQRPCSFIIFNVDNFKQYHETQGELVAEGALKKMARLLNESVTEIDKVARFGGDEFAVLLPEKNKREAIRIAEEIRKKIEFIFSEEKNVSKKLTVSGGVSENPIDGTTANELISKAIEKGNIAKSQSNKVEA